MPNAVSSAWDSTISTATYCIGPGAHPLEETMRAFAHLVDAGKDALRRRQQFRRPTKCCEAQRYARSTYRSRAIKCSTTCSERGVEHRADSGRAGAGIAIVGYTPFGRGRFPAQRRRGRRPRRRGRQTWRDVATGDSCVPHACERTSSRFRRPRSVGARRGKRRRRRPARSTTRTLRRSMRLSSAVNPRRTRCDERICR